MRPFFFKLIGVDYFLLKRCTVRTQNEFLLIFLLFMVICGGIFISFFIAFELLFENRLMIYLLTCFFSLVFINIYRLVLITSQHTKLKLDKTTKPIVSILLVKIILLLFIGFIVSQPIGIYLNKESLRFYVESHKTGLKNGFQSSLNRFYQPQVDQLTNELNEINADSNEIRKELLLIENEKTEQLAYFHVKILSSSFFLFQVKTLVAHYPKSYWKTLSIKLFFLLPFLLQFRTGKEYLLAKLKQEENLNHLNTLL